MTRSETCLTSFGASLTGFEVCVTTVEVCVTTVEVCVTTVEVCVMTDEAQTEIWPSLLGALWVGPGGGGGRVVWDPPPPLKENSAHACFCPPPHQTIWGTFSPCLRIRPILCTRFMTMARVVVGSGGCDILCCWTLISRLTQGALQRRFVVWCGLLGGLPKVTIDLGLEIRYLIQR